MSKILLREIKLDDICPKITGYILKENAVIYFELMITNEKSPDSIPEIKDLVKKEFNLKEVGDSYK